MFSAGPIPIALSPAPCPQRPVPIALSPSPCPQRPVPIALSPAPRQPRTCPQQPLRWGQDPVGDSLKPRCQRSISTGPAWPEPRKTSVVAAAVRGGANDESKQQNDQKHGRRRWREGCPDGALRDSCHVPGNTPCAGVGRVNAQGGLGEARILPRLGRGSAPTGRESLGWVVTRLPTS